MSSNNRLFVDGLFELRAQLEGLPAQLVEDAKPIVTANAAGANREITAAYEAHERARKADFPSHMKTVDHTKQPGTFVLDVQNDSPLARVFEWGSAVRHTALGANRGQMPAENVFLPRYYSWHHRMIDELSGMLEQHGFTVTGYVG